MGEVDRINQIPATPVITPRVSDGGQRRHSQEEEREAPRDRLELSGDETETELVESEPIDPVEEPYRLDIAI